MLQNLTELIYQSLKAFKDKTTDLRWICTVQGYKVLNFSEFSIVAVLKAFTMIAHHHDITGNRSS